MPAPGLPSISSEVGSSTSLSTFAPGLNLRAIVIGTEPWFVAKDVCASTLHSNPTVAVQSLLPDERAKFNLGGALGTVNIVNESGLYSLILKSRKPEAKAFKKWVTSVVLPAIRKAAARCLPE